MIKTLTANQNPSNFVEREHLKEHTACLEEQNDSVCCVLLL